LGKQNAGQIRKGFARKHEERIRPEHLADEYRKNIQKQEKTGEENTTRRTEENAFFPARSSNPSDNGLFPEKQRRRKEPQPPSAPLIRKTPPTDSF